MSREVAVVGAVIVRDGLVLCARRGPGGATGGMWEFPGGKIEPGETPEAALEREIIEELGCRIRVGAEVTTTTHAYDALVVTLTTYWCVLLDGSPSASEHEELRWLSPDELDPLAWAPADVPAVELIRDRPWTHSSRLADVSESPSPSDERNVLGGVLEPCGTDPMTGFFRDGNCSCGPQDVGVHAVCAVMTEEFLAHQKAVGNDLSTPHPEWQFPGLHPGDRWCVVAARWLQAHRDGVAAPVVLASTNELSLRLIPLEVLREHAVDVPDDPSALISD
ncbi:DUF2237 family protein [Nocardioides sp. Root190]|uniref:DUF2237 family protein n=1 Tax=Nocardioides sp. Root190 TaxID=1736488 RepID=UPI001F226085|nr:DUF2237 family protein [Nocardioides sp. Root190]